MSARYLSSQRPFTIEALIHLLDTATKRTARKSMPASNSTSISTFVLKNAKGNPYHTVPFPRRWSGLRPIHLEPVISVPTSGPSTTRSCYDREGFMALLIHLEESPSDATDFIESIESLSVRPGFNAKVLFQLRSSSTLVLLAFPSPIWECMSIHPAFLCVATICPSDPSIARGGAIAVGEEVEISTVFNLPDPPN